MRFYFYFLLVAISFPVNGQFIDPGLPFIQNYTSKIYGAHAQNWSIVQSDEGKMFFGNTEGIVQFDGNHWRLIKLPNEAGVLSLAKSNAGVIYAGAFGDIGYLIKDSTNQLQYRSLKNKIPEQEQQFEAVWETTVTKNNEIIFRTTGAIFIYDPSKEEFHVIKPEILFLRLFHIRNRTFFREGEIGMKTIIDQKTKLVQKGEKFADESIYGFEEYAENSFLVFTRTRIFQYYPKGKTTIGGKIYFELFPTEVDQYFNEHKIYHTIQLRNGWYAIGTSTGGIIIMDKKGRLIHKLREREGLQNNTVRNLYQDSFNNLWVATNNGLSYIILNSPIHIFNKSTGLSGIVFNTSVYKGLVYAATSTGLYVKKEYDDFEIVKNTSGEVFMLQKIDGELYAANSYSMYRINGFKATEVLSNYTWNLHLIREENESQYYVAGSSNGIFIYKKQGSKWNIHKQVKGFDVYARYLAVDNKNYIWVAHAHKGVYKIKLNAAMDSCKYTHYTGNNGLPATINNRVFEIQFNGEKKVVFGTDKGIYLYDHKNDTFYPDPFFSGYLGNEKEISRFEQNAMGDISFRQGEKLGILIKESNKHFSLTMTPFLKLEGVEIEHINAIEDSRILFGAEEGMYVYNPNSSFSPGQLFKTYINKVNYTDSVIHNPENEGNDDLVQIKYGKRSFLFTFSSGYYEEHNKTEFSYILEGYDDSWSKWTKETKKEYTNLREGGYTFKVISQNIHNTEGEMAQFSFEILPPWYRAKITYVSYFLFSVLLIWLIIKANTIRLKKAKQRLEKEVIERTSDLQEANVMLEEQHAEMQQQQEEIISQKEILEKQNQKISKQKDELEQHRNEIKATNEELEKLSIVASETDNSVIITDKKGDFVWANIGFSKLYEQSLNDFKRKYGSNIFSTSSNPERKKIKEQVLLHKKSAIYENTIYKSNGEEIWLQTTLTPILNNNGEVSKLIAIDSDISKLKRAENEIKKQNKKLEKQNFTITESINYAKTLQQHMLPAESTLNKSFDSFIIHKAKNIVSGDFYWYSKFPEDNEFYVALVDCTGHGVPGAFMTIMGIDLINSIVNQQNIRKPSKIVEKLDLGIVNTLKQKSTDNLDGMDLIFCRIKKENDKYIVSFVGANRAMVYYSKENEDVNIIKGWTKTVGGVFNFNENIAFEEKQIILERGDMIYLTSDGFADQLNEVQVKYGTKKLYSLLGKIAQMDLSEQKRILERELEIHQQTAKQYDDVTVWGIRLK